MFVSQIFILSGRQIVPKSSWFNFGGDVAWGFSQLFMAWTIVNVHVHVEEFDISWHPGKQHRFDRLFCQKSSK